MNPHTNSNIVKRESPKDSPNSDASSHMQSDSYAAGFTKANNVGIGVGVNPKTSNEALKTILTHSGSFQADDIFAVAILLMAIGESKVIRSRDKEQIASADYVVDVGMVHDPAKNKFDHHQHGGAGERPNGIPYASCGLVWKEYGEKLAGSKEAANLIDAKLMAPLDAHDNGVSIAGYHFKDVREYSVVDFLYSFLPSLHESEESLYKIFMALVAIAKDLLLREITIAKDIIIGEAKVRSTFEASTDKRILFLSEELPWKRVLLDKPEVMYVVYPRNDGNWGVRAVQDTGYTSRKPLPLEWGAKGDKELQEVTGVPDAVFCHRALFMAVAGSKEGAIKLAKIALDA
ncbi:MAG: metal-dependent hydrolase [Candidatus Zambryskibacteria bacterium CG22_combo_CG10-13_8_21_14_all_42_17]|uniref:Metal-dependent hydrolase n=1 Tax=Candidatus Zambryskibacteria bacterium CG22_combo_CG10-13_8_21_14_all_42_17 TaxID=1975118 RepID=A0A2H0BE70_9BACT|nr:MAG: metal-dependent hydrolase [Candidatus Zambryskibacteria bacterium CG22_combo_CG10-13_8_21_14_all_42_17]